MSQSINYIDANYVKEFYNESFFKDKNPVRVVSYIDIRLLGEVRVHPAMTIADLIEESHIEFKIKIDDKELQIPIKSLPSHATIDEIIKFYHDFLKENGPIGGGIIQTDQANPNLKDAMLPVLENKDLPILTEIVTYRGTYYRVEEFPQEKLIVKRQESGKEIPEKSPVWNAIINKYKNEAKQVTDK